MSAILPKADIAERDDHVRFVPQADVEPSHPIGGNKQRAHRTDAAMHLNVPAANTLQSWPF
jgi:hypothetical protein